MLITIDKEYEKQLLENGFSDVELDSFNSLFELMKQNKLFFYCSTSFYSSLITNYSSYFSRGVRSLLTNLIGNSTTLLSEAKSIRPLLIIGNKNINLMKRCGKVRLRLDSLPKELTPYICCENCSDSNFYMTIFKNLKTEYQENIYLFQESFGGSDGKTTIKNWLDNKKIFFSIVDSDIKYPSCPKGATAKSIENLFNSKGLFVACCYTLEVHEKENLFPFELLKVKSPEKEIIAYILTLNNNRLIDYRNHFDIKSGVLKKDCRNYSKPKEWKAMYRPLINYVKKHALANNQKKSKRLFQGIGSDEIEKRINEGIDYDMFWTLLTEKQRHDFERIFELIIVFGYCYSGITS